VEDGFEKKLEIEGIGYKAQAEGETISLSLGFTHPIKIKAPKGISFKVEKNTITINGPDKEIVGRVAANIRSKKPPEPYKGKGIHYLGEIIRRKAGKKAVGTA
jgi:large subunit ribosomal protein L6